MVLLRALRRPMTPRLPSLPQMHGVAAATHDHERDAMYAVLLDPKSNWPERPLTDEHTQEEIRRCVGQAAAGVT